MQIKLNAELFIKQKPALVLDKKAIHKVKLIQGREDNFAIEIELFKHLSNKLERITSENIGKRLVFISNDQILFAPLILETIKQKRIVIDLPPMRKTNAESIALHFSDSFEFFDDRAHKDEELDPDLKKAYELIDKGKYDKAIEALEQLLKLTKKSYTKIFIYNQLALCYRLKGDEPRSAETYRKLISEPVSIDVDNYMLIAQAYFYLSQLERRQQGINISQNYFDKGIATLKYIIKNFPTSRSAEWANLTIGIYELSRGNVKEAQKRAIMAKQGDIKGQGYLLLGLSYEYQKKFEEAKEEYKHLIENLPEAEESKIALEFIKKINNNKTNIEEFLKTLSLSF